MKTNELIALLQRIEHHNGGPLEVAMVRNLSVPYTPFQDQLEQEDTASFIQPGPGKRPRLAKISIVYSPIRIKHIYESE
jgi:hypothetical protein